MMIFTTIETTLINDAKRKILPAMANTSGESETAQRLEPLPKTMRQNNGDHQTPGG